MSTCADCKYYIEDAERAARVPDNHPQRELMVRGECRRYPPTDRRGTSVVSSSNWCGEWVAKA